MNILVVICPWCQYQLLPEKSKYKSDTRDSYTCKCLEKEKDLSSYTCYLNLDNSAIDSYYVWLDVHNATMELDWSANAWTLWLIPKKDNESQLLANGAGPLDPQNAVSLVKRYQRLLIFT